jgi:disulfide bond formation protein DsbB
VAEAVKSSREAYSQAQDAVRQAVKNAQDVTKAAAERVLATLIAVGGVAIARANTTLSDHTSRLLMLLIAAFLALLAVASYTLEAPLLSQPIKTLGADLAHQTSLLTDAQRQKVTQTPSLLATRKRLTVVKYAVPATYLVLALAIVVFGHPSRFA